MVNNSLAKKSSTGSNTLSFQSIIKSPTVQENIMQTLGDASKTKRFTASLISAVSTNPQLQECSGVSIISAALLGEALKLSPSPQLGHFYMVPFGDKNEPMKKATFQLGYKGYIQLAIRSGQYKRLNVVAVKDGELVKFNPFNEDIEVNPIEDPDAREKAKTVGYYAMFELNNGFKKAMYWSKSKMEAHAEKYSMGYKAHKGYTFWEKDFDGMAYKTMLRQLISKWGIMSIEMQNAFANDMTYHDTVDLSDSPKYAEEDTSIDSETGEVVEPSIKTEKDKQPEQESII
ncbi:MAG: recombinase RecT [Lachnospiraceae bacterium]|nr:recombinase RecT [Lachnospiraceae bacterium]